ncbi:M23 family metallopeptidase [Lysobacter sp. A421]
MKALLVFLAGLLIGANAVYFVMTWDDADTDAAVMFERERSQHAEPAPATQTPSALATASSSTAPVRQPVAPPASRLDAPPLSPTLSAAASLPTATPTTPTTSTSTSTSTPTPPEATTGAELVVPVQGIKPTQLDNTFDDARGQARVHEAIDIMAPRGTPVLAAAAGKVEKLFTSVPGGLTIYQFEPSGRYAYYYAHLDRYAAGLEEGKVLKRGDVIGYVGSTGNASEDAPHLHFAIFVLGPEKRWWEGTAINPYPILTGKQSL